MAIRTFIRVSGTLNSVLTIENLRVSYHGSFDPRGRGTASISYTVRNAGNTVLGGHQTIKITGLLGGVGTVPAISDVPLLLPGGTFPMSVRVTHLQPEGELTATVSIHPLTPRTDVDPAGPDAVGSVTFLAPPWTPLGSLVLLVVLVGLWWRHRARVRSQPGPRHSNKTAEKVFS